MSARNVLAILLIGYLFFAGWYSNTTPYGQAGRLLHQRGADGQPLRVPDVGAPDEMQHAAYIEHLLKGRGFPILDPKAADFGQSYEAHQPPLYYLSAAVFAKFVSADRYGPETGVRIRYLNVIIGAVTLVGVFMFAVWGFGREDLGCVAVAIAGFMPMYLALHGAVNNDPLLYCLCTWGLAFAARMIQEGVSPKLLGGFIVIAGLALLTKTTGLALIPIGIALAFLAPRTEKLSPIVIALACTLGPLLIASPWLIRNQNLYGDPFALGAFQAAFSGSPKAADLIAGLGAQKYWVDMFGWWTLRSFFGAFSLMDIFFNDSVYRVLTALAVLFSFALLLTKQNNPDIGERRKIHLLSAFFLVVVGLLYLKFNLTYFQAQARYLYPAICPIAIGMGLGFLNLVRRKSAWVALPLAAAMIAGNIASISFMKQQFELRMSDAQN